MADNAITISIGAQDNASAVFRKVAADLYKLNPSGKKTQEAFTAMEHAGKSLRQEFEGLANRLGPVGSAMKAMGPLATAAAAGIAAMVVAGVGLVKIASEVARVGDELDEMSYATGVSVENLSTLKYAADISGSSLQGLRTALKIMSVNAYDAAEALKKGGEVTNADALAWKELGISVTDMSGKLKPAYQLFMEAVDALSQLDNSTQRAAVGAQIFGRGISELLPLMAGGSEGIRAMQQTAKDLGGEFDATTAKAGSAYMDAVAKLGVAWDGFGRTIGERVIPLLTIAFELMAKTVALTRFFRDTGESRSSILGKMVAGWEYNPEIPPTVPAKTDGKSPAEVEAMARSLLAADVSNEQAEKDADRAKQLAELQRQMRSDDIQAARIQQTRYIGSTAVLGGLQAGTLGVQQTKAIEVSTIAARGLGRAMRDAGLANHAKIALPAWRELAYRIREWFTGDGGVLSTLRLGLRNYEEVLGTLASRVRASVVAGMQTYRQGVKDAVGGFLWGEEDRKDVPEAKKKLAEIAKYVAQLDLGMVAAGGEGAAATRDLLTTMFGDVMDDRIPQEYRDKVQALQIKVAEIFARPTAASKFEAVGLFGDLISEMEDDSGLTDRFKRLGEDLVRAMKEGMQTTITGALSEALTDGITGLSLAVLGGVWDGLLKGIGINTSKAIQAGLDENPTTVPAPQRSAFLNAMSDVGSWTETGVASVIGTLKTIAEYPVKGPNWTGKGGVFDTIADMGGFVWDAISGAGGILGEFGKLASAIHIPVPDWEGARNTFSAIASKAGETVSALGGLLGRIDLPAPTWEGARNTFSAIATRARSTVTAIGGLLTEIQVPAPTWEGARNTLSAIANAATSAVSSIARLLGRIDIPAPSWASASSVFDSIKGAAGEVVSVLGKLGDNITLPDLSSLASTLGSAFDVAGDIGKAIKGGLTNSMMVDAAAAGLIANNIGQLFSPQGAVGMSIGASLGAVIGGVAGPGGAALGAGIGAAIGGVLGAFLPGTGGPPEAAPPGTTTRVIGAAGGMANVIEAATQYPGRMVDLVGRFRTMGWSSIASAIVYGEKSATSEIRAMLEGIGWSELKVRTAMALMKDDKPFSADPFIYAKSGIARVPGGVNQPYPAILHGGERVLTAEENRSYGSLTFAPVFNITARSASDGAAIVEAIRREALPMLEREIDRAIRRGSRFGTMEMDARTLRSGL